MKIKTLELENFRSYQHVKVDFRQFNVLIGPNAAGKSNFIKAFRFLKDIVTFGLENAISLQGGGEYLRNINRQGQDDYLRLKVDIEPFSSVRSLKSGDIGHIIMKPTSFSNEFKISFDKQGLEFIVEEDQLMQTFDFYETMHKNDKLTEENKIGSGSLLVSNVLGKFNIDFKKDKSIPVSKADIFPSLFMDFQSYFDEEKPLQTLFIEKQYYMHHKQSVRQALGDLCIYDFDPQRPKQASTITGKAELEENGENLAIVLRKILKDEEKTRMLFNLIQDVLPFVEDLEVEKFLDRYLQITLKEKYSSERPIPASLMSDGTVYVILIIIALYFENKPIAFFEEAGRRIHPYLISKIIDMMQDAATHKQIILSTHNPEIVKYSGLKNIMFISRDANGYSTVTHLHDKKEIMAFMQNEIGIEELYVQNMLK